MKVIEKMNEEREREDSVIVKGKRVKSFWYEPERSVSTLLTSLMTKQETAAKPPEQKERRKRRSAEHRGPLGVS